MNTYKLKMIAVCNGLDSAPDECVKKEWFKIYEDGTETQIQVLPTINRNDVLIIEPDYGECFSLNNPAFPVNIREYKNLSLATVLPNENSQEMIKRLFQDVSNKTSVLKGISAENHVPSETDCFECISYLTETITRGGGSENFISEIRLAFVPGSAALEEILPHSKFSLVYGFGDPLSGEIDINVGKG